MEKIKNFISENDNFKIVDFYADWCGPCKLLGPTLEDIDNTMSNVDILPINVGTDRDLAVEMGVRNVPSVFIYKNGKQINKFVGNKSKEEIVKLLN